MVDPAVLTMVKDIVTILGVIGGFTYYVMNVRVSQRNQRHNKETREIQLLMEANQDVLDQGITAWSDIMNMQWESYEDFKTKYGWDNNPEFHTKRVKIFRNMNKNGMLVKDGLISCRSFVQYMGDNPTELWYKFKEIIIEQRQIFDNPEHYLGIEVLAEEIDKYRLSKGLNPKGSV